MTLYSVNRDVTLRTPDALILATAIVQGASADK